MSEQQSRRLAGLKQFLRSWYFPAALGFIMLSALAVWIMPRRVERVVSADGRQEWVAAEAPSRRQVLWGSPQPIEGLVPAGEGSVTTPYLTDNGTTLYFTYRQRGGNADIYRSRLIDEQWQPAESLFELNTEADDLGPVVSRDGKHLYFYSNRPGGYGGFDLYVADRAGAGWGKPRNLGATVNSPADEHDPAVSADGLSLYFSSNRPDQFDLYVSRRQSVQEEWSVPEALDQLNTDANESAPRLSPSGNFLYFASDRPTGRDEPLNLDLYRARLVDGRLGDVEPLGPGINTAAHETQPALSAEGFKLVFSSDRAGASGLYESTAREVYSYPDWDTTRLRAVAAVWWEALLLTLLLSGLMAVSLYARGWVLAKASAARFIAASLMLHCLLVLGLWGVPLARTVAEKEKELRNSEVQGPQLTEENLTKEREDRRQSFEKLAELKALDPVALPQAVREVTPEQVERLVPTIPLQAAKALTPERLLIVPPKEDPAEVRLGSPDLPRRPGQPRELAAVQPVPVEPAPAEIAPVEKPIPDRPIVQAKQDPLAPAPLEMPRRGPMVPGRPVVVEIKPAAPVAPEVIVQSPRSPGERRHPDRVAEPARTTEKVEVAVEPVVEPKLHDPKAAPVTVSRREPIPEGPLPPERVGPRDPAPIRVAKLAEPALPRVEGDVPKVAPLALLPTRTPVRGRPLPVVESARIEPAPVATAEASPAEKPLPGVSVALPRLSTGLPDAKTPALPREIGPAGPDRPRVTVRNVSEKPAIEMPNLSPLPGRLTRAPDRGSRVAPANDRGGDPAAYLLRQGDIRKEAIDVLGGTKESEAAVERGLDWLAAHQSRDGSWSLNAFQVNCKHPQCTAAASVVSDTAGTGLALLPFLAAGNTHRTGKHQQAVARALKWLMEHQRVDGSWLGQGDSKQMYGQALAAIALCEAYGMTQDVQFRAPAQKALDFIAKAQHAGTGGWRYLPNTPGDTSVLGWQVMAMRSGKMSGLSVSPQALEGAKRWLKSVEAPGGGQFGYQNKTPTPAMSAQGLLCLQLLGTKRNDPRLQSGAEYLLKHLPNRNVDTSYYWYHATQVMYHMQGKYWKAWNEKMRDMLVNSQIKTGSMAGTWDPVNTREKTGGRICSTALRLLMLEVYYRHLPLYQQLEK